jgi:hypothetical protein
LGSESILRELFPESGNVLVGGKPVRVASIAVENQRIGLQRVFEFFLTECNCLAMVVRAYDLEIRAVAHESPADRAIRRCARPISLVVLDGNVGDTAILEVSTFRFLESLLVRNCFARTLQQPAPDAPNLLGERIFEILNSCQRSPARRYIPAFAFLPVCAAFHGLACQGEIPRRKKQTKHNR